ncbi:MAG: hypothetical protein ACOCVA_07645 [Prolixibacteraceae bacterium]
MKIVFFNSLVKNPRYKKILIVISILIVFAIMALVFFTNRALQAKKGEVSPEEYQNLAEKVEKENNFNIGFGIATLIFIIVSGWQKQNTKIIITPEKISYDSPLRKTDIKWEDVKKLKILNPDTYLEKCEVKSEDKKIVFNCFFLDEKENFEFRKNGIFDEHGEPIPIKIKKSKIYKQVSMRTEK